MDNSIPVMYVISCGSPAARGIPEFAIRLREEEWNVCVIATPDGAKFIDAEQLEHITGFPVRSTYKDPEAPDVLPPADAFVVAPATFNTINKFANGISDTLALGLLCEGIGSSRPIIAVPWMNRALAGHGAYKRSLDFLAADGVKLVLTERTQPGAQLPDIPEPFPWERLLAEVSGIRSTVLAAAHLR